jgi:hypothetical protein
VIGRLIEIIGIERTDDIPPLWEQIRAMGVIRLIDKHFPPHANWAGELTPGEVVALWLSFIEIVSRVVENVFFAFLLKPALRGPVFILATAHSRTSRLRKSAATSFPA